MNYCALVTVMLCCCLSSGEYIPSFSAPHAKTIMILPVDMLGLANRLRTIASLFSVAESIYHCNMIVIWQNNVDCPVGLNELFRATHDTIDVVTAPLNCTSKADFDVFVSNTVSNLATHHNRTVLNVYVRHFLINTKQLPADKILVMHTKGTHAPVVHDCNEYIQSKQRFYSHLIPTDMVSALVDAVTSSGWSQVNAPIIGVHMRAFDERYDWPVVSPHAPGTAIISPAASVETVPASSTNALRFDESSTIGSFLLVMERILSIAPPGTRFYLASNSIRAKEIVTQHFGANKVITLDSAHVASRDTADSMFVAAAEFVLLSRSSLVVHSRGSSFAREAAAVHGIPVIDVTQHGSSSSSGQPVFFHSHDGRQPQCAMPEYIRAQKPPSDWPTVCYDEDNTGLNGTVRSMCTVQHHVCECDTVDNMHSSSSSSEEQTTPAADPQTTCTADGADDGERVRSAAATAPDVAWVRKIKGVYCVVSAEYFAALTDVERAARCVPLLAESNGYTI